jgi:hypothetical protein
MPTTGQITGTDDGVESTWLLELDDVGSPITELVFIPMGPMPRVVPIWSIELPIDHIGIAFTDEAANPSLITMLRDLPELKRGEVGS